MKLVQVPFRSLSTKQALLVLKLPKVPGSLTQLKTAYIKMAKVYHPDSGTGGNKEKF
jgi:curved DNA-binding protein CbpA